MTLNPEILTCWFRFLLYLDNKKGTVHKPTSSEANENDFHAKQQVAKRNNNSETMSCVLYFLKRQCKVTGSIWNKKQLHNMNYEVNNKTSHRPHISLVKGHSQRPRAWRYTAQWILRFLASEFLCRMWWRHWFIIYLVILGIVAGWSLSSGKYFLVRFLDVSCPLP